MADRSVSDAWQMPFVHVAAPMSGQLVSGPVQFIVTLFFIICYYHFIVYYLLLYKESILYLPVLKLHP